MKKTNQLKNGIDHFEFLQSKDIPDCIPEIDNIYKDEFTSLLLKGDEWTFKFLLLFRVKSAINALEIIELSLGLMRDDIKKSIKNGSCSPEQITRSKERVSKTRKDHQKSLFPFN